MSQRPTPVYTARVDISLDTPEAANTRSLSGIQESVILDDGQITTEIEVIQSEAISRKVVDELDLTENALFLSNRETGTLSSDFRPAYFRGTSSEYFAPTARRRWFVAPFRRRILLPIAWLKPLEKLQANMAVTRVRGSRILQVSYTAMSPSLAARIANGIADVYINDQLEAKYDANERATNWLRDRARTAESTVERVGQFC